jgi:tetratricopeptide (TPR) repeat protein
VTARNHTSCPPASELGSFVEGTLDRDTRAEIARHVAECSQCVFVASETARFLANEAKVDPRPGVRTASFRWRWSAAAALAGISLAALIWQAIPRDPLRRLRALAARSDRRETEGHLHDFPHARFDAARADAGRRVSLEDRAELERLMNSTRENPETLHARGVAALLSGDAPAGVIALRASATKNPKNASTWSDLAAANIALRSYPEAVAAADRAIALDSQLAAAHFNRALALDRMGRPAAAALAYRLARQTEDDPRWRLEIDERLSRLPR